MSFKIISLKCLLGARPYSRQCGAVQGPLPPWGLHFGGRKRQGIKGMRRSVMSCGDGVNKVVKVVGIGAGRRWPGKPLLRGEI